MRTTMHAALQKKCCGPQPPRGARRLSPRPTAATTHLLGVNVKSEPQVPEPDARRSPGPSNYPARGNPNAGHLLAPLAGSARNNSV
jgi:hypothetical protein